MRMTHGPALVVQQWDSPGCSMFPCDRALWTLHTWLDSWGWDWSRRRRYGSARLRSPAHAVRRPRLASHVLHDRDGAQPNQRDGHRGGTNAAAREAAGCCGALRRVEEGDR